MNNLCDAKPMIGNEAITQREWKSDVKIAAAYPGTPSTEILEFLGGYPAGDLYGHWSTNEKVACDFTIGASFEGMKAMTTMKHFGLNHQQRPAIPVLLFGVNGGLVF